MTNPATDPEPIPGVPASASLRPVSVRRLETGWVVIDHGGEQVVSLRMLGTTIIRHRPILPVCCFSFAVGAAEVLRARYRDEELPAWTGEQGRVHPPMRGGAQCPRGKVGSR